jgi:hypothetical protein
MGLLLINSVQFHRSVPCINPSPILLSPFSIRNVTNVQAWILFC